VNEKEVKAVNDFRVFLRDVLFQYNLINAQYCFHIKYIPFSFVSGLLFH